MSTHAEPEAADGNDAPLPEGILCVFCGRALCGRFMPDEKTAALWLRGACRPCADRYALTATMQESTEVGASNARDE